MGFLHPKENRAGAPASPARQNKYRTLFDIADVLVGNLTQEVLFHAIAVSRRRIIPFPRPSAPEVTMKIMEIWRYPVKTMGGEKLHPARPGPLGIEGDRGGHAENAQGQVITSRSHPCFLVHKGW